MRARRTVISLPSSCARCVTAAAGGGAATSNLQAAHVVDEDAALLAGGSEQVARGPVQPRDAEHGRRVGQRGGAGPVPLVPQLDGAVLAGAGEGGGARGAVLHVPDDAMMP